MLRLRTVLGHLLDVIYGRTLPAVNLGYPRFTAERFTVGRDRS